MEEAYRTAGVAVLRLLYNSSGDRQHLESEAVLRYVLRRRPVVLGFVVSTLALKLCGGPPVGKDRSSCTVSLPHAGVCSALEAILASYDPAAPHSMAAIIDALGEEGSKILLHMSETAGPSLPWAPRLCLLHACLADSTTSADRQWKWLPIAADSLCSQALQALTKQGSSTSNRSSSNGKGKRRATNSTVPNGPGAVNGSAYTGVQEDLTNEPFSSAVVVRVCSDLATVGTGTAVGSQSATGRFLSGYSRGVGKFSSGVAPSITRGFMWRERGDDWLQGFRFKLQALRGVLLDGAEVGKGHRIDRSTRFGPTVAEERGIVHDVDVRPGVVERALETSRCGEAFILAVQNALGLEEATSAASLNVRKRKYPNGYAGPVKLKSALVVCLFGTGLPAGQGLLDFFHDEARPNYVSPAELSRAQTPPRRASTFLQCLVLEGIRVRDLLMLLLHLRGTYGLSPSSSSRENEIRRPGRGMILQIPRDAHRLAIAQVVHSLVEWLADTAWAWTSVESSGLAVGWEEDFAAAAAVVMSSTATTSGGSGGTAVGRPEPVSALLDGGRRYHCDEYHEVDSYSRRSRGVSADPIDLMDRLVAAAATAASQAAQNINWVDIIGRITAIAGTDPVSAYAAACVERSVALGGQAPFPLVEGQRLSQAGGQELWHLLEQSFALRGELGGSGRAGVVLIRTTAAAVASCREASRSWMISPGLLSAGPVRLVIDMIQAARGSVTVSAVLSGLLSRLRGDGPALAADAFAAIVVSEAPMLSGEEAASADDCDSNLPSQAVTWLGSALSSAWRSASRSTNSSPDRTTAASSLANALTRRVPFETKSVLFSIVESAEIANGNNQGAKARRLHSVDSYAGGSGRGNELDSTAEDNDRPLEALIHAAQAALESPLLPLPVPSLSPSLPPEKEERGGAAGEGATVKDSQDGEAAATAGLILDSFMQTPGAVMRALRAALQRGNCTHELLAVQRALRVALCTQGSAEGDEGDATHPLPPGLGSRRADACLLMGHLVELGVPGWVEAKAAMNPPPRPLIEVAELPLGRESDRSSRQRFTALRLEMWLRKFLCDSDADWCHGTGDSAGLSEPSQFSLPDVFRTARTLACAVSRHASYLIMDTSQDGTSSGGWANSSFSNGSFSHSASRSDARNGTCLDPSQQRRLDVNGYNCDSHQRRSEGRTGFEASLNPPQRALVARLQGVHAVGALGVWVSNVVKTAARYRQWLPWQAFSDELRRLLLLRTWKPFPMASNGGGAVAGSDAAAVAATFAVCELLLAWDGGQEVPAAVFDTVLCSSALKSALAPVPSGLSPPVWLDVLRCLLDVKRGRLFAWGTTPRDVGITQQDSFALAAAASVWIGGGGLRDRDMGDAGNAGEAWMRWYGAKLWPLIPTTGTWSGKWLVLSASRGKGDADEINVRAGVAGAARTLAAESWKNWGRTFLEAAWNVPAGRAVGTTVSADLPAIVLPPFASWLRMVIRGGSQRCSVTVLEGYLRRMAREVYLPCEFGGASSEMARQWLGALIEAEAAAEAKTPVDLSTAPGLTACSGVCAMQGGASDSASTRRAAVNAFFREELLRFGSGEVSGAPVGAALTWLWPLEAVVSACSRAGPLGGQLSRSYFGTDVSSEGDDGVVRLSLDDPPSALARALTAVPYDLLCGARRFDVGDGETPPATLRAFAMRAVDLAARALAIAPCRHWSVARRLLLGLGLLYHALATPHQEIGSGAVSSGATPSASRAAPVIAPESKADDVSEAATAQAAALKTIESLLRIAFGMGRAGADEGALNGAVIGWQQRPVSLTQVRSGTSLLTTACRSLRPLETGGRGGWQDFLQALRSTGAWRTATALSKPPTAETPTPSIFPVVRFSTTSASAVSRSRRQSLPPRWERNSCRTERSARSRGTQDDSGFHVGATTKSNGISTTETPHSSLREVDRKPQRSEGQSVRRVSPSGVPQPSPEEPLPSNDKEGNVVCGSAIDSEDETPVEAKGKAPSSTRKSYRSARRTAKALE